jgi:hypothetical protein
MQGESTTIPWKHLDFQDFLTLVPTEQAAFDFALTLKLIDLEQICDCGHRMNLHENQQKAHGFQWMCTAGRSKCCKKRSILAGSWFARSKLGIRSGLICVAAYAGDFSSKQFGFVTGIKSGKAIASWKNFFRDICAHALDYCGESVIGGVGLTVEVDESLVFNRKYHRGRVLANEANQEWVCGGICRETGAAFAVQVWDRSARALLDAIQARVLPGTTIMTDSGRSYKVLAAEGYPHSEVNHSLNFVDPKDPKVHTQKVERMWRTLKSIIPEGSRFEDRSTYLLEFLFKQKNQWYSISMGERIKLILDLLIQISFE